MRGCFFIQRAFILFVFSLSLPLLAKGPPAGASKRGGAGFLFEDFNGFSNPAQKAHFKGFAAEAKYETTLNTGDKSVTPSVVWGRKNLGIGAFVTRAGSDLSAPNTCTDTIGGAVGLGLAANRITVGVGFTRSIDVAQTMDGVLTASANWNGLAGKGFHLGGALSTTVNRFNREIRTGTGAVGWGFGRVALEAIYTVNDLQDPAGTNEMAAFFTWEGNRFFLGAGMGYKKAVSASYAAGRLGVKLGKFDLSAFGDKTFSDGQNPTVGASLRVKF